MTPPPPGLPQLPLFFALVNYYKADVRLQTRSGATPLALAITAGEETLAEVGVVRWEGPVFILGACLCQGADLCVWSGYQRSLVS